MQDLEIKRNRTKEATKLDETSALVIFYGFFALLFAVFVIPAVWAFHWFFLVPKDARQLAKAKSKRRPINILFYDEGFCEFVACKKPIPEILENPDGSIGVLPSKSPLQVGNLPIGMTDGGSPIYSLDEEAEYLKNSGDKGVVRPLTKEERAELQLEQAKRMMIQEKFNDTATKRFMLKSVGVPVTLQYLPKAIAMNAPTLALLRSGELHKDGVFLNPLNIKPYFSRMWIPSRLKTYGDYKETIGRRSMQGMMGKWEKWFPIIILGMICITILVLAIVAAKFV